MPVKKNSTPDEKPAEPTPTPTASDEKQVEPTPTPSEVENNAPRPPENPNAHDHTDVEAALQRQTQDGKGDEEVPESDFQSFATEGVERGEKTDEEIALEVVRGKWGTGDEKREKLKEAGYDPTAIARLVNRHLTEGAPTVFPTTVRDDAVAVIRGEWGDEESEIKGNLSRANKNADEIWAERTRQLGL